MPTWNINYADEWQEAGEAFEPAGVACCLDECRAGQLPERLFLAWLWLAVRRRLGEPRPGCVLVQDDLGRPHFPEYRTEDN